MSALWSFLGEAESPQLLKALSLGVGRGDRGQVASPEVQAQRSWPQKWPWGQDGRVRRAPRTHVSLMGDCSGPAGPLTLCAVLPMQQCPLSTGLTLSLLVSSPLVTSQCQREAFGLKDSFSTHPEVFTCSGTFAPP